MSWLLGRELLVSCIMGSRSVGSCDRAKGFLAVTSNAFDHGMFLDESISPF
jgi:hypothetical protein